METTDKIGGRKFIAYLLSMAGWALVFVEVMREGVLTQDITQSFLFYLILIQAIFFGGNLAERLIRGKFGDIPKDAK